MMNLHRNPQKENWTGRSTEAHAYWHQLVQLKEDLLLSHAEQRTVGLLGYAVEEGVRRNLGRVGTAAAPNAIRKILGTLAYHLPTNLGMYDYGDILVHDDQLEKTHDFVTDIVYRLLKTNHLPVLLGGGHDLAYAHGRAVFKYVSDNKKKLGIINMDAHFDLKPLVNGSAHSGSPFMQLAQEFPNDFHYLVLGIQRAANPRSLFQTASELSCNYLEMESFHPGNWEMIQKSLQSFLNKVDHIYLSIDLDGFSSAYAPGVSAPSPLGFSPELAFKVFDFLTGSKKIISMDVVEMNPSYDQDNATARLAARCVEYLVRSIAQRSIY
jgi:formiminoglutamase